MSEVKSVSRTQRKLSRWYQVYFAAVTEPDNGRALLKIYLAQEAMHDRLLRLRRSSPDTRELQDLNNAWIYLQILLPHLDGKPEKSGWQ